MRPKETTIIPDSPKERVRDYLRDNGIRHTDAEKQCGFSRGYLGMGGEMTTDKLRILKQNYPTIDIHYIVTGEQSSEKHYKDLYDAVLIENEIMRKMLNK